MTEAEKEPLRDRLCAFGMCALSLALMVALIVGCVGGISMLFGYKHGADIANAGFLTALPLFLFFGCFAFVAISGSPVTTTTTTTTTYR